MQELMTIGTAIATVVAVLVGVVVTIVVAYAGFMYATAAGDPQKTGIAKNAFVGAFIGLIIASVAFIGPRIITDMVIKPVGGVAIETEIGLNCDGILRNQLVFQRGASTKDRMNVVKQLPRYSPRMRIALVGCVGRSSSQLPGGPISDDRWSHALPSATRGPKLIFRFRSCLAYSAELLWSGILPGGSVGWSSWPGSAQSALLPSSRLGGEQGVSPLQASSPQGLAAQASVEVPEVSQEVLQQFLVLRHEGNSFLMPTLHEPVPR